MEMSDATFEALRNFSRNEIYCMKDSCKGLQERDQSDSLLVKEKTNRYEGT